MILILLSVYYNQKINYINYKFISMFKNLSKDKTSLFLSLGTKIGVGSIIGTVSSVLIGGTSAILWMIIFSFITSSLIYVESYLGIKYREKQGEEYIGGPYFIIKKGLNNKILAFISLILLIVTYSFFFQMIQTNTIANVLILNTISNKFIIFILFLIILIITISFNIKEVINSLNKLVPFMCLFFILVSLYIIFANLDVLYLSITKAFDEIYNFKSFFAGALIGIKRSIFMNETMIGTTSLSSAIDKNDLKVSINIQVIGTYFISFIVSVLISLIMTIYSYDNFLLQDYNILIIKMFKYFFGGMGSYILVIIYILFGVTTILSGYYIGKSNIEYITNKKIFINGFKILFCIFALSGVYLTPDFIWKFIDNSMILMIVINIYCIIKLGGNCDWK